MDRKNETLIFCTENHRFIPYGGRVYLVGNCLVWFIFWDTLYKKETLGTKNILYVGPIFLGIEKIQNIFVISFKYTCIHRHKKRKYILSRYETLSEIRGEWLFQNTMRYCSIFDQIARKKQTPRHKGVFLWSGSKRCVVFYLRGTTPIVFFIHRYKKKKIKKCRCF